MVRFREEFKSPGQLAQIHISLGHQAERGWSIGPQAQRVLEMLEGLAPQTAHHHRRIMTAAAGQELQ